MDMEKKKRATASRRKPTSRPQPPVVAMLIASDEPQLANALAGFYRSNGYEPVVVESLPATLERLGSERFDLVAVAEHLGGRSPREIRERIRRTMGGSAARVI